MTKTNGNPSFENVVAEMDELIAVCGEPAPAIRSKIIDRLDHHCREFIARSPFFLLSTTDATGRCDVSPRGGPPGFVEVLDEQRIVFANAKGNQLIDSLRNICQTRRAGLLFLIPGMSETLRVNGRACLTRDPGLLDAARRSRQDEPRTSRSASRSRKPSSTARRHSSARRSGNRRHGPRWTAWLDQHRSGKTTWHSPTSALTKSRTLVEESYRELY